MSDKKAKTKSTEKLTHDELFRGWLAAKQEEPLLSRQDFANRVGVGLRTLEKALSGTPAHATEVSLLSKYIANTIEECAKSLQIDPRDMQWHQFRQYIQMAWGKNNAGIHPHHITMVGGFNKIRDSHFPANATRVAIEKERITQVANFNRKMGKIFAEEGYVTETIEKFANRVFEGMATSRGTPPKAAKAIERAVTVVLSDLHIGSDINAEETGVRSFGKVEEARRIAKIAREVVSYKPQYRDQTTLEVLLLGDIIEGILHNLRDGADLAEQCCRAIRILTQFVTYVAASYPHVNVRVSSGNHGRNKHLHPERAISKKYDSWETVIYYSIKEACSNLKNVKFFIPKTPYISYEVLGSRFYATHGDTNLNPGNPGKAIPIGTLENQTNKINAALSDAEEYSAFIVGHVHTASMTYLANGAVMITNGAIVPPNPHAVSMSIMETACGQWLFESVKGYPIGDTRFLRVDSETDQDESLDSIIAPYKNYED